MDARRSLAPRAGDSDESSALRAAFDATRELLWVERAADAKRIASRLTESLGGRVAPARSAGVDALPVDLSFGDGDPVVPIAGSSTARTFLERYLPGFVLDAQQAVALCSRVDRLAEDASIDSLTRLPNRRMVGRSLGRLSPGEAVVMLDLDHFKAVNDTFGHDAGDEVLRAMGRTLEGTIRAREIVGRYGGEEFVAVVENPRAAQKFLERLHAAWEAHRPYPVTFSAGVAEAGAVPADALQAADRALYRAKDSGRNRWVFADTHDFSESPAATAPTPSESPVPDRGAFVAYNRLPVPDEGHEQIEAAVRDRLAAVAGFRSLELWVDNADPTSYVMVSWWDTQEAFQAHMHSSDHRRSDNRIPPGEPQSQPKQFRRYRARGPMEFRHPSEAVEAFITNALEGNRRQAEIMSLALLDRGVAEGSIISDLLAASQREVGDRWHANELNVADEHLATTVTESALRALASAGAPPTGDRGLMVVACAEGDWHSLAGQMFAEQLSGTGSEVIFLGASAPPDHVARYLGRHRPTALAISCSIPIFFGGVVRLTDAAHSRGVPVIVGGRAFASRPESARKLGADAWGNDIQDALTALADWRQKPPAVSAEPTPVPGEALQLALGASELAASAYNQLVVTSPGMSRYTTPHLERTRENLSYIVQFTAAAHLVDDPSILTDFLDWLVALLAARNVGPGEVRAGIEALLPLLDGFSTDVGRLATLGLEHLAASSPPSSPIVSA